MALTSQQKYYIKKNMKQLSVERMADDLNLAGKEIEKYIKKHLPQKRYEKLFGATADRSGNATAPPGVYQFIIENINYFILLSLLVIAVYFNSINNAFVSDDIAGLAQNQIFTSFKNIFAGYNSPSFLPYFIFFKISASSPVLFRIWNILMHLGTIYLIFILLFIMTRRKNMALIAALIFAVHPLLIESVTWISGRPYTQYAFFFLLSFIWYIISKENNNRYYYFSLASYGYCVMTSEKATPLFLIFILYEICFGNLKKEWKKIIPYFVFSGIIAAIVLSGFGQRVEGLKSVYYQETSGAMNPLVQVPIAIASYIGLFLWPQNLTLYHTEMNFPPLLYALCVIVFLSLSAAIFYGWKKNKLVFFWLSFFIISLLPTLTPFGVSWIVAERYVYLGTLGLVAIIAYLFDRAIRNNENFKPIIFSAVGIIVALLSIRTVVRNIDWKNEDNLWFATAKVSPSGAPIHNNMGDVYARRQDYPKAIEEFTKATKINPGYADAFHNLANTYQMAGKQDEAVRYYQKALEINPNIWQSYQNLAAIYFERGDKEKSFGYIQKALEINPDNENLKNNLEIIRSEMK